MWEAVAVSRVITADGFDPIDHLTDERRGAWKCTECGYQIDVIHRADANLWLVQADGYPAPGNIGWFGTVDEAFRMAEAEADFHYQLDHGGDPD